MDVKNLDTLVLSGGGTKCISFIGVFKKFEELNIKFKTICSVSAGSFFALLYIVGYSSREMSKICNILDFTKLRNINYLNFLNEYGLDNGSGFTVVLEELVDKVNISKKITFLELYNINGIDFQVMACNLNTIKLDKFNYINTPDLCVIDAIRMSINIPFFFTMKQCMGNMYIDGGAVSNFPIHLFENTEKTLGVTIKEDVETDVIINSFEKYIMRIIKCLTYSDNTNRKNCIYIKNNHITSTLNFSLTNDEKKNLVDLGYQISCEFFNQTLIQI